MMMRFLESFDHLRPLSKLFIGFGGIGLLGFIDLITGYEIAVAVFYIFPIAILTWNRGLLTGLIGSLVGAIVWIGADISSGNPYSHPLIPLWNTIIRLISFLIIVLLIVELKQTLNREKTWARTDSLTGAVNSRLYFELVRAQMERAQRYSHPFTVAYMDLDNFKTINDQFGHATGDQVLQTAVATMQQSLRKMDIIARLGGDEFALLLPETNELAAKTVLAKVRIELLKVMQANQWPVTLSMGVITCDSFPNDAEALIQQADTLMYIVKHNKKDGVEFLSYRQPPRV